MKKVLLVIMTILTAMTLLVSCAKSGNSMSKGDADNGYSGSTDYGYTADTVEESTASPSVTSDNTLTDDRKIIKNAEMTVQTKQFDKFISSLESALSASGGYTESKQIDGSYDSADGRDAYITIRIPADKLDGFMHTVSETGTVVYENTSAQDVTSSYNDIERHIESLKTEQTRLLELLKKAESLSDILDIESRLTDIRYQLDSYEQKLNTYDDRISYSTLTLTVYEVERETVTDEDGFGTQVAEGFMQSLTAIGKGFRAFAIGFLSASPFLILLAVIAVIVLVIVKICIKKSKSKQAPPYTSDNQNKQ